MDGLTTHTPSELRSSWARRSVSSKMAALAAIMHVLLVPMLMLGGLITESEQMHGQLATRDRRPVGPGADPRRACPDGPLHRPDALG